MIGRTGWRSAVTVLGILVLTSSCTNLSAVREWSKTSLEATQYNELVATYANTPERLKRCDPQGDWDEQIALRANQAKALRQLLAVVSDYMAALATLSADSTIAYDKDIVALTTALGDLQTEISATTVNAVGSLGKAVVGAAAKAYRARQVAKVVEQVNAPLQTILHGELRRIVDRDFRRDLEIEKLELDGYYDNLLRTGTPSPAARVALEEWKELRLEQNALRLKVLDAYLAVLDKIAEGHRKIYDNRNRLNKKTLIRDLLALVIELNAQIRILAEA